MIGAQHRGQKGETHGEVVGLGAEHCEHGRRRDVPVGDADQEHHQEEEAEFGDENSQEEGNVDLREIQGGKRNENQGRHGIFPNEDIETPGLWRSDNFECSSQPAQKYSQEDLSNGRNQISQVNVL